MILIINWRGYKLGNTIKLSICMLLLLVLTACGKAAGEESPAKETDKGEEEEVTLLEVTDASGEKVAFDEAPETFAALNSGDLDVLLALGANVTGRPTASGPVADELKEVIEIGNLHQPNFEKIAEAHPDVLAASMGFQRHAENIERQGTKVVYTKADSVADIQGTIELFGQLLQKETEAEEINNAITEKVNSIDLSNSEPTRTLLVYGAPGTYLAALPNSLSGDLLELAGGENIASDFPQEESYPQYASLSVEKIIERNPEMVMLITHGDPDAVKEAFEGEMEKNAAWKNLDAVKNGNVVVLPSHLFGTNPGTNVTEALDVMIESLEKVQ